MAKHRGHNEGTISTRTYTTKDGSKVTRYIARLPVDANGKRPSLGSFQTKTEAREALKQAEVARAQGTLVTGKVPTVKAWCETWLDGRPRIAYTTRQAYRTSFKAIFPYIGAIPLDKLMESDIAVMWDKLAAGTGADGKPRKDGPLAPTTLDRCHRHLNAALRAAVVSRHVAVVYNPARAEEAKPERGEREEIHPLTEEEVQRLFLATKDDREHVLWVTLITTGVRHGEAQAIRWQDIDFDRKTVSIRGGLHFETGKGWIDGATKTKRNRVITLRQATVDALRKHKIRQAEMRLAAGPLWEDRGLVFTTDTGRPMDQRFIQRSFDRACERAGISRRKVKECRHTFATLGLVRNVPVKVISEALGHAKVGITYDIYSHVIAGLQEESLSHLDRLFV